MYVELGVCDIFWNSRSKTNNRYQERLVQLDQVLKEKLLQHAVRHENAILHHVKFRSYVAKSVNYTLKFKV